MSVDISSSCFYWFHTSKVVRMRHFDSIGGASNVLFYPALPFTPMMSAVACETLSRLRGLCPVS